MVRMRNNKDSNARCCSCGDRQGEVLGMYDICIGRTIVTVCDVCNEVLLSKTLKAEVAKNGRVKSSQDMAIIRRRQHGTYKKEE